MKKYLLLYIMLSGVLSCSSEESKIKRALKSSIPEELVSKYKLKDFTVMETILDVNVRDSISLLKTRIDFAENRMKADSSRLLNIQSEIISTKHSQATTLYWLRSSYNSIIRSYEKMETEILESIEERQEMKDSYSDAIKKYEEALASTTSPIIYYIIKHNYTINSAIREEVITLDSNYNLVSK